MLGFKRNPNDDFATFWKKPHHKGHDLARIFAVSPVELYLRTKHRLAGHIARFESGNPVYQMLVCRNLAWWRQEQRVWRVPVAPHSLYQALLFCFSSDVLMVQFCWIWLVWIIWQLVWTSTWQLGWKVRSTLRCRVVQPEVRHWKLESYRLQTLCECRERRRGYPAVVNSRKNCCPG